MSNVTAMPASPKKKPEPSDTKVVIKEPNFAVATVGVTGTAPYLQNRFSGREEMVAKQKAGSAQAKTRRAKPPKDFDKAYRGSMHVSQ